MASLIHVINASSRSDTGITRNLEQSLAWVKGEAMPQICCVTLQDGPNGISTARDSDDAAPAVLRYIERHGANPDVSGFVVACFSDPGVYAARELTRAPVIGIGEAGLFAGLAVGDTIATIGVSQKTDKTARLARQMGVDHRVARHVGLGLDYGDLQYPEKVTDILTAAGREIAASHHVQALVLAGAGLARYVKPLSIATGLPVIDPTQAAVATLLGITLSRPRITT